ncbi:MAG: hypothetical protein Q8Q52_05380 [Acidimicrobiia bacterium]|nr:hypothetical protein [Acidimicrobiia bacterium]
MIRVELFGHGIGGRLDLPVPLSYFTAGAALVLIVTFVGLAALWPQPRLQEGPRAQPSGFRPPVGLLAAVGVVGLLLTIIGGVSAMVAGPGAVGSRNIAPLLVWVVFWLVVPFAGAIVGDLYTALNPWRALAEWLGLGDTERPELTARWGLWPAAVVLFSFAWLELIYPESATPGAVATASLAYTIFLLILISRVGRETALTSVDAFESYNRLISGVSPMGRDDQGHLVRRGWLRALVVIPQWRGLAAFVVVMIGTVSYDGLSATGWWEKATGSFGASMLGGTVLMLALPAAIGGAYFLACLAAAWMGGRDRSAGEVAARFAHTLVPIALAYAFAHYFTLILFEGQQLISSVSDPFGLGWDLFGTRDHKIDFFLGPIAVWYIQVGTIVAGHLAGVVLAHDRALADFRGAGAVRSQYAMLGLMVTLTSLGLFILAG